MLRGRGRSVIHQATGGRVRHFEVEVLEPHPQPRVGRTSWDKGARLGLPISVTPELQPDRLRTSHALYLNLGPNLPSRQLTYRALSRHHRDQGEPAGVRMATQQKQPLGSARFLDAAERMTGLRWAPKPRGRPRRQAHEAVGPGTLDFR